MIRETGPEAQGPSLRAKEIAGALQGVVADVENRDFSLDVEQEAAINAIGSEIIGGETAGYIDAHTGFGKTLHIALLAEAAVRAGKRVHILASTTDIADQLIGAGGNTGIGRFTGLLEGDSTLVKQNYGGRRASTQHPVVVSTYPGVLQEARAVEEGGGRLGAFDLILADECHRSLGTETSRALYGYMPGAIRVGFSATPNYAADRRSEEIFNRPWFEFSLKDAIESGRTAPVRALLLATDTTLELSADQHEFTEKELAPLIDNPERNGIALKLAQDFVADGRQVLIAGVAGGGNRHAVLLAGLLSGMEASGRPIVAADVGSHLSKDEHRRRLQAFRDREIDILISIRALEEGVDLKTASAYINLQPTDSERRIKQMLGRILRKNLDGRESIFIDFVDEKEGINKSQYTALHALEFEDVDSYRVLGEGGYGGGRMAPQSGSLARSVRPELLARLMRMQGRTLVDALATHTGRQVDPLVAQWERTLTREGMPSELPDNIVFTPALDKKYRRAAAIARDQQGTEPTPDEIIEQLISRGITKEQERVVRELGQRVLLDTEALGVFPESRESIEDVVVRLTLSGIMRSVLDTLSEREAGILMYRFGLIDDKSLTRDEIGRIYGISRERVAQIERSTMSKMRSQDRATLLLDFVEESGNTKEDQPTPPYQKATIGNSTFRDMPTVPIYDSKDRRPYAVRLEEASEDATQAWLEEKTGSLGMLYLPQLQRELAVVSRQIELASNTHRRVLERPMHPQSQIARDVTVMALEIRMQALGTYSLTLQDRIAQMSI